MLFLDSSDPREIKDIFAWGVVKGVTTNPLIIAREAGNVDLEQRIRDVDRRHQATIAEDGAAVETPVAVLVLEDQDTVAGVFYP